MLKQNSNRSIKTAGMSFLITGNLIGVGILALPIHTGLAGFMPSILSIVLIGITMFYAAFVLANESTESKDKNFHYPSLYEKYLGNIGKWVATIANLIILYGLLISYTTSAAKILAELIPLQIPSYFFTLLFFGLLSFVAVLGNTAIQKYNFIFIVVMWFFFIAIIFMSEKHVQFDRLIHTDWKFFPSTIPAIITSFHFHNLIPTVSKELDWHKPTILKAACFGMLMAIVMNILWIQVSLGSIPIFGDQGLMYALKNGIPATLILKNKIDSPFFSISCLIFPIMALSTSFLANSLSLVSFMSNLNEKKKILSKKSVNFALSFVPPLVISLIYPDIFLKVLNIVGGIGIVILSGTLPCFIEIVRGHSPFRKKLGYFFLAFYILFLVFEVAQEFGLLNISADKEYYIHVQEGNLAIKSKK